MVKKKAEEKEPTKSDQAEEIKPEAPQEAVIENVPPEPVEAPQAPVAPKEPLIDLQDAARHLVVGFKEHWMPSIKMHAINRGVVSPATLSDCKAVLESWGAKLRDIG